MGLGKILSVDDDELNRDTLREYMTDAGYDVVEADDGDTALQLLNDAGGIDAIILDRMMPRLNGLEVFKAIKTDPRFADIPVIMQSAASARVQIQEGINAGVYYYLTKPYEERMLLAIVRATLEVEASKRKLRAEVTQQERVTGLMEETRFAFRTFEEARSLAVLIANRFPDPRSVVCGLNELLVNAVEHGNLGITYDEKTKLVVDGRLENEIERRLALLQNQDK